MTVKIPFVLWRNGRPRFVAWPALRKAGHKGHDLRNADGSWMTEGQCLDWSNAFAVNLEAERLKGKQKRDRERKQARAKAIATLPAAPVKKSYTLGQLLEDFLSNGMAGKSERTPVLYRTMANNIENDEPMAWASEAAAIGRPVIIAIYDRMLQKRGPHSSRLAIRVLSAAYNWAIDREKVASSPVIRIRTLEPKPRVRAISVAEYWHLKATSDRLGLPEVADMLVWGIWTAQRTGDRLAMRPQDIRDGRLEITQQKTGADVSIDLASEIRARLIERPASGDRIIAGMVGAERLNRLQNYRRKWRDVVAEAQKCMPSLKGVHDQDLRDTAVSWMGRAGCTAQQIFSVTGHRQPGETRILRHYMAVHHDIADQAIAKLEAWYAKELKKLKAEAGDKKSVSLKRQ